MYTLGKYIIGDESIKLPIANMAATLAYIIIPVGIGLAINRFLPKVKKFILKLQKPVILVTVLFAIIMGKVVNITTITLYVVDEVLYCAYVHRDICSFEEELPGHEPRHECQKI